MEKGAAFSSSTCLLLVMFLVLLTSFGRTADAPYGPRSDVTILTRSNFEEVVNSGSVVLVEFFIPWCVHSNNLAPQWEKAATALKGAVTVAAVDCDSHLAIAEEYGIQGFPTIKVFGPHVRTPQDYQGPREAKDIVNFALSQLKSLSSARLSGKVPSGGSSGSSGGEKSSGAADVSIVLTNDNFDKLVTSSKDLWLVEFYDPWCGHCKNLAPEWQEAAWDLKGKAKLGQVDCTVEEALARRFDIKGFPTILVFGSDKDEPKPYVGGRTAGAIESFVFEELDFFPVAPDIVQLTGQVCVG